MVIKRDTPEGCPHKTTKVKTYFVLSKIITWQVGKFKMNEDVPHDVMLKIVVQKHLATMCYEGVSSQGGIYQGLKLKYTIRLLKCIDYFRHDTI